MGFIKNVGRSAAMQETLGFVLASYLKLVKATNSFVIEPADLYDRLDREWPVIIAMWHGQHFMVPFGKRPQDEYRVLISRHGDGGINAIACRYFGIEAIRGAGGKPQDMHRKGAVVGMREMLRTLRDNRSVTVTADVPKIARVAGDGLIALAKASGRPILPYTVVTSRRIDFNSWDRASVGKPFGRGAMVMGETVRVARDADAEETERARLMLQNELDRIHKRAYELVGRSDPGAGLREGRAAA
ncbi:lysophospholipid acyltransferase family protein [Terrarubrum flagellatum]|uniref:lysophospholipid acyltransferase family protein n=1 Tax=Terrirubrum flagellatum TaxID=2895980 RepID=UPI0031456863